MSKHRRTHRHDWAMIAARAEANPRINTGANFHVAAPMTPMGRYQGRGSKRPGSDKGQGLWRTTSPNYRNMVTVDSRWSK